MASKRVFAPTDMAQVGLVVSLGHCSCGSPQQHMMPQGSMRMLDPNTNGWVATREPIGPSPAASLRISVEP
jgi:hypothetical protein